MNQVIALHPQCIQNFYQQNMTNFDWNDYQQAIADCNTAIKLNPNLAEAYGNRGFLHVHWGDKLEGLKDLHHAAQLFLYAGNMTRYQQTIAFIKKHNLL